MKHTDPALMPLFRSRQQLEVMAHLFIHAGRDFSAGDLVAATGVSQPTVWREIQRLQQAGLITVRSVGRTKLVEANRDSPYFSELQSLSVKLLGPKIVLAEALEGVAGVEDAYIFGSWAKRYRGEAGPPPNDLDVLVVGDADPDTVDKALMQMEARLQAEVNAVVVSPDEWARADTGFLRQLKKQDLVPIVQQRSA